MTGTFWSGGPTELADTVAGFDTDRVDPLKCVESARRFDVQVFKRTLPREVERAVARAHEQRGDRPAGPPPERPVAVPGQLARGGLARIS